ncbi:MAG: histidine phosphotransferase family protein [Maritimibacter sp.]
MSDTPPRDLVSLVGSRICHDLISPLGAIGNGLELLELSGVPDSPEMALIGESVSNANARIKFFRVAYGAAAPGAVVSAREINDVLTPNVDGRKVRIHWNLAGDPLRTDVKLAFLMIQCLETVMPWGGDIDVSKDGDRLRVAGRADQFKDEPALWAFVTQGDTGGELPPARVEFGLIGPELASQGRQVQVTMGESEISFEC